MAGKIEDYEEDFDEDQDEETAVNHIVKRSQSPKGKGKLGPYKQTISKSPRRPTSGKKRTGSAPGVSTSKSSRELWLNSVQSGGPGLTNNNKGHPGKRSTVEYWVDTLRKSRGGISTESSGKNSMTGLKKTQAKNLAYMSSSHYLRQMAGLEKTGKNTADPTAKKSAGTPAYKSPEEYYDEIIALKKQIVSLNNDAGTMKSKLRRLEEDNAKKTKEIENLLDPSKSDDMRRTLTDRKPDAGAVIHSLKQKNHKLGQQLKEKEAALAKIQSDIKTTKMEEMRTQMEAYYQEVLRLSSLRAVGAPTTKQEAKNNHVKEPASKLKALQDTILRMNEKNVRLTSENKSLKQDLEKMLEKDAKSKEIKNEYEDMNKKQLMNAIVRLEKKIEKRDATSGSISSFSEENQGNLEGKIQLEGNINERLDQLDKRETQLLDEAAKQRSLIKKLKDDRAHYRAKSEEQAKEIKSLQAELDSFYDKDRSRVTPRPTPRNRPSSGSSDSSSKREARERSKRVREFTENRAARHIQKEWRHHRDRHHDEEEALKVKCFRENQAAKKIQREWRLHQQDKKDDMWHRQQVKKSHRMREDHAARRIQRGWREHQQYEQDSNDAALTIQSALRGHASRRHQLRSMTRGHDDSDLTDVTESEDMESAAELIQSSVRGHWARRDQISKSLAEESNDNDNAEVLIQSAIRGHQTRKKLLANHGLRPRSTERNKGYISPRSSDRHSFRTSPRRSVLDSEGEEDELSDDLIVATTSSRRPDPGKSFRSKSPTYSSFKGRAKSPPTLSRSKTPPKVLDDDDDDSDDDDDIIITSTRSKLF